MPKTPIATFKSRFMKQKDKLLNNPSVCPENRELFKRFFEYQEYKLARINNLSGMDESSYKTCMAYITRFKNINRWFENKPITNITKEDLKAVYDGLEDGTILRPCGKPYLSRIDYYGKVFKGKLFELAGKEKMADEIMEFYKKPHDKEVRFVEEDDFLKIEHNLYKPKHKLLAWLAFDIGENINSLLRLKKSDFCRQENVDTKKPEYRVNLRREILKRSRTPRSEITNFDMTSELLDQILPDLKDDELLFPYGYNNAKVILSRAVQRSKVKCQPKGELPSWKDLRSSMACDLLKKGWSTDEVNKRLGHRPSSSEIDKYVNYMALDRHSPKKKLIAYDIDMIRAELEATKEREKRITREFEAMKERMVLYEKAVELNRLAMNKLK